MWTIVESELPGCEIAAHSRQPARECVLAVKPIKVLFPCKTGPRSERDTKRVCTGFVSEHCQPRHMDAVSSARHRS